MGVSFYPDVPKDIFLQESNVLTEGMVKLLELFYVEVLLFFLSLSCGKNQS
jgi:hypothetical protein